VINTLYRKQDSEIIFFREVKNLGDIYQWWQPQLIGLVIVGPYQFLDMSKGEIFNRDIIIINFGFFANINRIALLTGEPRT
jgi:hypothetical protein